jgi:hypothetical protein
MNEKIKGEKNLILAKKLLNTSLSLCWNAIHIISTKLSLLTNED